MTQFRFELERGPAGCNRDYADVRVTVCAETSREAVRKAQAMSSDPAGNFYQFWLVRADEITNEGETR